MRLLVVHAHPLPDGFGAFLCHQTVSAARANGHEVRLTDLYAIKFDPVMSTHERLGYEDATVIPADIAPHIDDMRWAEGLIFVYPTWWSGQPAILKGWLDRVWRPGVAFVFRGADKEMQPGLPNIRLLGVVTTLGAPWWVWALALCAPGRKALLRGLRPCTAKQTKTFWLALHSIDTTTPAQRARFVRRIIARVARLPS